jgi:predicted pyridoxine 5'-phosphate oxidase superfamily flavin-nucleotide-binding protein
MPQTKPRFAMAGPEAINARPAALRFSFSPPEATKVSTARRSDRPGFVEVSDDGRTLLIPDRRGNNKIDGLKNLVEDPRIGLIFFVPGANETYRVNGRARISVDGDLKRRFTVNGKEPATVMVITVEQTFPPAQRRWSGPTCGKRAAVAGLKVYRRWATSWQRAIREPTVPRSTKHIANAFRTSSTDTALHRGTSVRLGQQRT